ncbi:MAG: AAA-like domain-containing protein [Chroococcidiopsidaceae cyanobacterium CP_BM_ER_R8_30]|nr:AAA-like domain-containing protein [Chroococcidiopsidaceae cyanobacterium CP_BM_ER_R8_30]
MDVEEALAIADALVFAKTGKHLSTLQATIFRGTWSGQKYEQIAEVCFCSDAHVKAVGASLWELVSKGLEEKVSKKTFRAALERRKRLSTPSTAQIPSQLQAAGALLGETVSSNGVMFGGSAQDQIPVGDASTSTAPATPPILDNLEDLPLSGTEPELPEGQVDLASTLYVERPPIESRCYETILKPGALIRIKAPRKTGKTSLMARILVQAAKQGYHTVPLSFQLADGRIFQDLDKFLRWFCVNVGLELQLPNQLANYWDEIFGSKISCKAYFEQYLLTETAQPLVLALDDIDRLFQYPDLAEDFLGLLRTWHEEAKNRDIWKRLRLIVVHSTEIYLPLNINQSPFNVGLPIELPELTSEQVQELARRHGLDWSTQQAKQLMALVGGHPYLVRLALYHIWHQDVTLEQVVQTSPISGGIYSDHLQRQFWHLQQEPELALALAQVVTQPESVELDLVQAFKLQSIGLIHLQGNHAVPSCELYYQYFRDHFKDSGLRYVSKEIRD